MLRILRISRLVRVFKVFRLPRYKRSLQMLYRVFSHEKEILFIIFSLCLFLVLVSSIFMWNFEYEAQPEKFTDIITTMWWSVVTLTTVGYGDIYPITPMGKILASFIGIGRNRFIYYSYRHY
ncbi:MAG: potassium channel family protein [Brevinema sp.]